MICLPSMILYYIISHWFFCTMNVIISTLPNPYKCCGGRNERGRRLHVFKQTNGGPKVHNMAQTTSLMEFHRLAQIGDRKMRNSLIRPIALSTYIRNFVIFFMRKTSSLENWLLNDKNGGMFNFTPSGANRSGMSLFAMISSPTSNLSNVLY